MPPSLFRVSIGIGMIVAQLMPSPVEAKCPFASYAVGGRLILPKGVDHAKLHIALFVADAEHSSAYPPSAGEQDFAVPGPMGEFEITSHYSTTAVFGCGKWEESAELIVLGEGIRSLRVKVKFPKDSQRSLKVQVNLPPIYLEGF